MRVIECNYCGQTLSAANDDDLTRTALRHMEERHPGEAADEAAVRALVVARAYEASDS